MTINNMGYWDKKIQITKIPSNIAKIIEDRVRLLIAYSMHTSQAKDLINNIARNCYTQGLFDGEKLHKIKLSNEQN